MKPSEFAKLQAKWDKKLKDSGFEDLEYRNQPYGPMKSLGPLRRHIRQDLIRGVDEDGCSYAFSPTAEFYSRRTDFLLAHRFSSKGERYCFQAAVEGKTPSQIARELQRREYWKCWTYRRVRYALEKLNRAYLAWTHEKPEDGDDE